MNGLRLASIRVASLCTALATVLFGVTTVSASTLEGLVVGVTDGDTVTILVDRREVKVRVAGIDAPEKKQPFGQRSKQAMSECAYGKPSQVDWDKTDRYGRTIGKVTVDGVDCGLRQIELGLAWHYKAYAKEQTLKDREAYGRAEEGAKADRLGLWTDPNPLPPWDYRHSGAKR
jgi:endonuclease YncB( thermonuclease family)